MSKTHGADSRLARSYVHEALLKIKGIVNEDEPQAAISDWFVVGGRSTGILANAPQSPPRSKRDPYRDLGYPDDAMIVTPKLYLQFLAEYDGLALAMDPYWEDHPMFLDLDGDNVTESFIGTKWLVVVDYHS